MDYLLSFTNYINNLSSQMNMLSLCESTNFVKHICAPLIKAMGQNPSWNIELFSFWIGYAFSTTVWNNTTVIIITAW